MPPHFARVWHHKKVSAATKKFPRRQKFFSSPRLTNRIFSGIIRAQSVGEATAEDTDCCRKMKETSFAGMNRLHRDKVQHNTVTSPCEAKARTKYFFRIFSAHPPMCGFFYGFFYGFFHGIGALWTVIKVDFTKKTLRTEKTGGFFRAPKSDCGSFSRDRRPGFVFRAAVFPTKTAAFFSALRSPKSGKIKS